MILRIVQDTPFFSIYSVPEAKIFPLGLGPQFIVAAAKDSLGLTRWIFFMLWPSINYVVFPTVQTLTSDELRKVTFGWMGMGCLKCSFANPFSKISTICRRMSRREAVAATAEEIEMNALNNNVIPV